MERIPVAGPWITDKEVEYVADAARGDWYAQAGRYTQRFERAFADHVGVRFATSLPHCTAGLHLALAAMGVGPGDQVIVPDATWIASSAPITYVGATPIFADVDPHTWCLTADAIEQCISPHTKAIIAVDLYGSMPDFDALCAVADKHGVALIEDAAEAIGSTYHVKPAGSFGDVGVFSFHGSKTLTTGEGGILATDDEALFRRVLQLRDHGRPPGDRFFRNTQVAFKYKMSSMQAAMGLAQLERLNELIARKRDIFSWYQHQLADLNQLSLNVEPAGVRNSYWMITAVLDDRRVEMDSEQLMAALDERGIDTRPFFHPLSSLQAYADADDTPRARKQNTVSYRLHRCSVNLPSALCLTQPQVNRVCQALQSIIA